MARNARHLRYFLLRAMHGQTPSVYGFGFASQTPCATYGVVRLKNCVILNKIGLPILEGSHFREFPGREIPTLYQVTGTARHLRNLFGAQHLRNIFGARHLRNKVKCVGDAHWASPGAEHCSTPTNFFRIHHHSHLLFAWQLITVIRDHSDYRRDYIHYYHQYKSNAYNG